MKQVGSFEAKTHFSSLLEQVEQGEQIIITRHGRPIAKMVPFSASPRDTAAQAIDRIIKLSAGLTLGDDLNWKDLRDEGRA